MVGSGQGVKNWVAGIFLFMLLYALYVWRPRVGAGASMMILGGVLLWQKQNGKGLFAYE